MPRSLIAQGAAVLALALSAACGSAPLGGAAPHSPSEPGRPPSVPSASTVRSPTRTAGAPPDSTSDLPVALVGSWVETDTGTISYRLSSDTFESIEELSNVRPHGTFEIRVEQKGRAAVDGDRLILTPTTATTSQHDPEDPGDSYTGRPGELVPRIYTWHIVGPMLTLKNDAGLAITLTREP
jgi:hypothetical protein